MTTTATAVTPPTPPATGARTTTTTITTGSVDSPVGALRFAVRDGRLVGLAFDDHWHHVADIVHTRFPDDEWVDDGDTGDVGAAIEAYVDGDVTAIDGVDVDPGGTAFQRAVWAALRTIPVGETWSYGDIAAAVGSPGAVRAVGSANGANPVSVVVPCHRVIRSDGTLGGYGGGLERKVWLLDHEGVPTRRSWRG